MDSSQILTSGSESVATTALDACSWQRSVGRAIRSGAALCRQLGLPERLARGAAAGEADFPVFVPQEFLAKIRPGDAADPLLRQVLPLAEESDRVPGYSRDPLQESAATAVPGVLQKYPGRALLVSTNACAVHCRYCFRRHFPYDSVPRGLDAWNRALDAIREDASIEEVLLSGGDPLMLVDSLLGQLVAAIDAIPHVARIRLHTRLPVMIPSRVSDELLQTLRQTRAVSLVVIHSNHPREIDATVGAALGRLVDRGIPVLNQSVLLQGVNDDAETLVQLSQRLVAHRVMPYYLHQLDRVAGAAQFAVPTAEGLEIMAALRQRLPGYAVPRYVVESPGVLHKEVIA